MPLPLHHWYWSSSESVSLSLFVLKPWVTSCHHLLNSCNLFEIGIWQWAQVFSFTQEQATGRETFRAEATHIIMALWRKEFWNPQVVTTSAKGCVLSNQQAIFILEFSSCRHPWVLMKNSQPSFKASSLVTHYQNQDIRDKCGFD